MIRVTYTKVCDICETECSSESYNCTSLIGNGSYPLPKDKHTYQFNGVIELCDDCALPMLKAKEEIIEKFIATRGQA